MNCQKTQRTLCLLAACVALVAQAGRAQAGFARFARHSDTILVDGHTVLGTAATYEAIVRPDAAPAGQIWGELTVFEENKLFGLNNAGGMFGYAHFASSASNIIQGGASTSGDWHHYAYVYDGAQERVYIDGTLVASLAASGNIGDSASGLGMAIGAQHRTGSIFNDSFIGDIDTLRISTVARYAGTSFTAPTGDFTTDASTAVLFNFNEAPGSTTVTDEANGFVGTLGTQLSGFGTSPTLIPEPATLALLALAGLSLLLRRRR